MSSETFVPVARVADIGPGSSAAVTVAGRDVALFNIDGVFYALENACPHQGAPIDDGFIDGLTVTCPWHGWCFRLTDGQMTLGAFAHVDAFEAKIEGGNVLVSRTPRPRPAG